MNRIKKIAYGGILTRIPTLLSKTLRGRVDPSATAALLGRRFAGVNPGHTFTGDLAQSPLRTAFRAALGPKFKYRPHAIGASALANAGMLVNDGRQKWNSINDYLKGLAESSGVPIDNESFRSFRNQMFSHALKNMRGAGVETDSLKTLTDSELVSRFYSNLARKNLLPFLKNKAQSQEMSLNPYDKHSPYNYTTLPQQRFLGRLSTNLGRRGFVRALTSAGIGDTQGNPFTGLAPTKQEQERLKSLLIQDASNVASRSRNPTVRELGEYAKGHPEVGITLANEAINTLNLKNRNPLDVAGSSSLGLVMSDVVPRTWNKQMRREEISNLLENRMDLEPSLTHTDVNWDNKFTGRSYFNPETRDITMGGSRYQMNPGILAHESGHALGFRARPDLLNKAYMGSNIYANTAGGLLSGELKDRHVLGNLLTPSPGTDGHLALSASHAVASTPQVAMETEDSIRGAAFAHRALRDQNVSNYERGVTVGGAFTGLPTYYRQAYSPFLESIRERNKQTP